MPSYHIDIETLIKNNKQDILEPTNKGDFLLDTEWNIINKKQIEKLNWVTQDLYKYLTKGSESSQVYTLLNSQNLLLSDQEKKFLLFDIVPEIEKILKSNPNHSTQKDDYLS